MDDRKKRLQAQRDALLAKRKQEREQELKEYNTTHGIPEKQNSFYEQMRQADNKLQPQKPQEFKTAPPTQVAAPVQS